MKNRVIIVTIISCCIIMSCTNEQIIERDKTIYLRRAPLAHHFEMGIPLSKGSTSGAGGYQSSFSNPDAVVYLDTSIHESTYLVKKTTTATHYYESANLLYGSVSKGLSDYTAAGIGFIYSFGSLKLPGDIDSNLLKQNILQTSAHYRLIVPVGELDLGLRFDLQMMVQNGHEYYTSVEDTLWDASTELHNPNFRITSFARYKLSNRTSAFFGLQFQNITIIPQSSYEDIYSFYCGINYQNGDYSTLSPYVSLGLRGKSSNSDPTLSIGISMTIQEY